MMLVPQYNQATPSWASIEMAPGFILRQYGCFDTCVAMALANFGINVDPGQLCLAMKSIGGFDAEGNMIHSKLETLYPSILDYRRVNTTNAPGNVGKTLILTAIDQIRRFLATGMPVMLWVDNVGNDGLPDHWVLIKDFRNGDFLINNPDGGVEQWFSVKYGDITKKLYGYYVIIGSPLGVPDTSTTDDKRDGQAAFKAAQVYKGHNVQTYAKEILDTLYV